MVKVVNLGAHRAGKTQDDFAWTPLEMARFVVEGLEDGSIDARSMSITWADKKGVLMSVKSRLDNLAWLSLHELVAHNIKDQWLNNKT